MRDILDFLPMRVPPRLVAVLGFVAVGMLALVVAGLLDWIVGVLFLTMEFLGEVLRNVFRHRRGRRHLPARSRPASVARWATSSTAGDPVADGPTLDARGRDAGSSGPAEAAETEAHSSGSCSP